jgi:hypothetical protein
MVSHRRKRLRKRGKTRKAKKFYFIGGTGDDKCVFVPLSGGLGNQLYIYAASIMVKRKTGLPLCFLPCGNNPHKTVSDYRRSLFKQGRPANLENLEQRKDAAKMILGNIHEPHNTWANENINDNISGNALLKSSWYQSYSSISPVIPIIREDFAKVFQEAYPDFKIDSDSSAFMHVRRGDYGGVSLSAEYYNKGLAVLEPSSKIQNLYILSDDMDWCKAREWKTTKNVIFFEEPDELKSMYLMSLCLAGALISASTFSSWGAILGADKNLDSVIVYPASWITGPSSGIQFPARWNAI